MKATPTTTTTQQEIINVWRSQSRSLPPSQCCSTCPPSPGPAASRFLSSEACF